MTTQEKEDIKSVYEKGYTLRQTIIKLDNSLSKFEHWCKTNWGDIKKNEEILDKHFKKSILSDALTDLKTWVDKWDQNEDLTPMYSLRQKWVKKVSSFSVVAELYIAYRKSNDYIVVQGSDEQGNNSNDNESAQVIDKWFFYYLNPSKNSGRSTIARTVLTTYDNSRATLKANPKNVHSEELEGPFREIAGSGFYYFDLKNEDETRECHFKIQYPSKKHSLVVGIFTNYAPYKIRSGSLVLEKITSEDKLIGIEPIEACPKYNPNGYQFIPDYVQDYLYEKTPNYGSVPQNIGDKTTLVRFNNDRHRLDVENRDKRFFDFETPKLFIAAQQTSFSSGNDQYLQENTVVQDVIKLLSDKRKDVDVVQREKSDLSKVDLGSFTSLVELKRTKYFVLIVTRHEKASFSTVMLGWAMAYCMHILVLYREDTVSDRFLALSKLKIDREKIEDFDPESVMLQITRFIDSKA